MGPYPSGLLAVQGRKRGVPLDNLLDTLDASEFEEGRLRHGDPWLRSVYSLTCGCGNGSGRAGKFLFICPHLAFQTHVTSLAVKSPI